MELKKLNVAGREVEFANAFRGTRNGFAHDTTLFIDGRRYAEATCHYINRTWECYTYQSVMRKAVSELIDEREENLKYEFKRERGYDKMTAKRLEEFKAVLEADEQTEFYREIYKALA